MGAMSPETIALVERVARRLANADTTCTIAGPSTDAQIDAAEEQLGCEFPPTYRAFLRQFGAITMPTHVGVVHSFVGLSQAAPDGKGVVERTLSGRTEKRIAADLIVVGMGANYQEWFCLDLSDRNEDGEAPIVLFDARDNARDQKFYETFGEMLDEVLHFIDEHIVAAHD